MTQQRKPIVRWTKDEQQKLAIYLAQRGFTEHSASIIHAVRDAQATLLGAARSKRIEGRQHIETFFPALREAIAQAKEDAKAAATHIAEAAQKQAPGPIPEISEPFVAPPVRAIPIQFTPPQSEPTPQPAPLDSLDALANQFAKTLTGHFLTHLKAGLAELLTQIPSPTPPSAATTPEPQPTPAPAPPVQQTQAAAEEEAEDDDPPQPESHQSASPFAAPLSSRPNRVQPRKPKVVVVGLRGGQKEMIAREFADLNLEFVESGSKPDTYQGKARSADTVFAMADFVPKPQMDALKRHANFLRVTGGMDKLRDTLNRVYRH